MDSGNMFSLQEVPQKGLGLVAAKYIPKGTRILSEAPILRVSRSINSDEKLLKSLPKDVAALSDNSRQAFFSLHNAFRDTATPELGIILTNNLPLGPQASQGGIFVQASRINHACLQNAQNTWNDAIQQLTIHSIRDIAEGEEITILYLRELGSRSDRQRTLQQSFGFTCSCRLCSLPPSQLGRSDVRLKEILQLDESIGDGMNMLLSPLQALDDVRRLLELCDEEGIVDASIPRAYYDAFQIAVFNGDLARAKVFAGRVCATRKIIEGDGSTELRRVADLAKDPTRHSSYGYGSRWRTSTDEIPSTLEVAEFDLWLWKKQKKTPKLLQCGDLRDDSMFPSFKELPEEHSLDLEYFDSTDGLFYSPRRHWCFLAEIVDIEDFVRRKLVVEDKAGHVSSLLFYTSGRGAELPHMRLRKGFTVAVLYPLRHGFLDMTVGIRHEDPEFLKIFPIGLKDLLSLSDKVQQYATDVQGETICQGCGRKSAAMKKCAGCSFFWYCNKECQTVAWKEKGHKQDCKFLCDADLRMLFLLAEDNYTHQRKFSDN